MVVMVVWTGCFGTSVRGWETRNIQNINIIRSLSFFFVSSMIIVGNSSVVNDCVLCDLTCQSDVVDRSIQGF